MYEIRKYLTERYTAVALIGTSRAGKSTFAKHAFHVKSQAGCGLGGRTRIMRRWSCPLPTSDTAGQNRQFTLIDFPGFTDFSVQDWYFRGQLLANVLVIVMKMDEMNTTQGVTLIRNACKARSQDSEVEVLVCLTMADNEYKNSLYEAHEDRIRPDLHFIKNFKDYKRKLLDAASQGARTAGHLKYIGDNMHACCFMPALQDENSEEARELMNVHVRNVAWVKQWCVEKLSAIGNRQF